MKRSIIALWVATIIAELGALGVGLMLPPSGMMLDLRFWGFSTEAATQWLEQIGQDGRQTLLTYYYNGFDLVFPLLFGMTLASLILLFGRNLPRFARLGQTTQFVVAGLIVAPYVLFDYAQNNAVVKLLYSVGSLNEADVTMASSLNIAKFVFMGIALAVVATFGLAARRR